MMIFLHKPCTLVAQSTSAKQQAPAVIGNWQSYQQTVKLQPLKALVNIKQLIPGIQLDLRYAGKNNFTKQVIYQHATTTYLRKPAADALAMVQAALNKLGLGLKIFDAYRPYRATKMMWNLIKDERYVANPARGSDHNRALAVDLTIINLASKKELDMGTGFDNFTDSAHHDFKQLPPAILQNRLLLKHTMEQYGFKAMATEWWHYAYQSPQRFEVLDLDFDVLRRVP